MDPEIIKIFQYWIRERENIRIKRAAGETGPWTDDPILQTYKYCNVRREDDRVTVWIRQNIREPYADNPNLFFMLCMTRFINWPPTIYHLMTCGLWPEKEYKHIAVVNALSSRAQHSKVWTGAYLLGCSPGGRPLHIAGGILKETWDRMGEIRPNFENGLQATHSSLIKIKGWGFFLAYQVIVDTRFTNILGEAPDRNTWCAAGPGTIAGLNYLHSREKGKGISQTQALDEIHEVEPYFREVGVDFDFSDIPNILCEGSKYIRIQQGGRMRARFRPTTEIWPPLKPKGLLEMYK